MAEPEDLSNGLILVVDDEPVILRLTSSVLSAAGFRVLVAEGGAAALETWNQERESVRLVLTDVVMPQMSGVDLAGKLVKADPDVRILFMSGYTEAVDPMEARRRFPLIRKPFLPEDLVRKVRETIEAPLVS